MMGSSSRFDTITFFYIARDHKFKFPNYDAFRSQKIVFILANSADPGETLHFAAVHLDLLCLPKWFPV